MPRRGSRMFQGISAAVLAAACAGAAWTDEGVAAVDVAHFDRTDLPVGHLLEVELAPIDTDADMDVIGCLRDHPGLLDVSFLPNRRGFFALGERQTHVGDLCVDLVPAHLDRDGVLDLAVSEWYPYLAPRDPELVTLLGNGDGTFTPAARYPLSSAGDRVVAGDFDDDGNSDIALSEVRANRVEVFLGRGDGTLEAPLSPALGGRPSDVAVADVDSNGADDLVVANRASNDISVLLGERTKGLFAKARVGPIDSPGDLALVDADSDGALDIAALARRTRVRLFFGSGDGEFEQGPAVSTGWGTEMLESADFNADSAVDLAVARPGQLGVFFGRGNGRFTPPTVFSLGPPRPHYWPEAESIAAGRVNRDQFPDLVAPTPRLKRFLVTKRPFDCRGRIANVIGSENDDRLFADELLPDRRLVIAARSGDDESAGGKRADVACLGAGDDAFFSAGGGADVIWGASGDDGPMKGGAGDDRIAGGRGDDVLGRHRHNKERGDDILIGGKGHDLLNGGPGWDICDGGAGHDGSVGCEVERNIP